MPRDAAAEAPLFLRPPVPRPNHRCSSRRLTPRPTTPRAGGDLARRLRDDDRERLALFAERFAAERALAPRLGLDELLRRVVDATGYDLHVLSLPGGARRLANVHKLMRLAAAYERDNGRDVRGLADFANAELEAEARETDAPVELGDVKAVRLMSIHAAKGLEFGTVCVADLGRRRPPDADDLLVDGDEVGLRLVGLDGSSEKALAYERCNERARERAAREERARAVRRADARLRAADPQRRRAAALVAEGGAGRFAAVMAGAGAGRRRPRAPAERRGPGPRHDWSDGEHARDAALLAEPPRHRRPRAARSVAGARRPRACRCAGQQRPPQAAPPDIARPRPRVRTLSYSSLAAWGACGYRFYLTKLLRLREEPVIRVAAAGAAPTLDPRVRGTLVHALLEQPGPATAERVAQVAADLGVALTAAGVRGRRAGSCDAFERLAAAPRLAARASVQREHGFAVALGDTLLTGIVDVLATERGGMRLVVDYKTDALEDGADLAAFVAEHYDVQRRVYALAALRGGAARTEVAYAFLERPQEPVSRALRGRRRRPPRSRAAGARRGNAGGELSGHRQAAPRAVRELPGAARAVLASGGADAARASAAGDRDEHVIPTSVRGVNRVAIPLVPSVALSAATTGAAALGAAGVLSASVAGPATCLFSAATGVPCPFCGLTHGVAELGAGQLATAVALHPLSPLAALLALAVPVALLRRRSLALTAPRPLAVLAAIVMLTWIVRVADERRRTTRSVRRRPTIPSDRRRRTTPSGGRTSRSLRRRRPPATRSPRRRRTRRGVSRRPCRTTLRRPASSRATPRAPCRRSCSASSASSSARCARRSPGTSASARSASSTPPAACSAAAARRPPARSSASSCASLMVLGIVLLIVFAVLVAAGTSTYSDVT